MKREDPPPSRVARRRSKDTWQSTKCQSTSCQTIGTSEESSHPPTPKSGGFVK